MKKSILIFTNLLFLTQIFASDKLGLFPFKNDSKSLTLNPKSRFVHKTEDDFEEKIVLDLGKIEEAISNKNSSDFSDEQLIKIKEASQIKGDAIGQLEYMLFPIKDEFQTCYHSKEALTMFQKNLSPDRLKDKDCIKAEFNYILRTIACILSKSRLGYAISKDNKKQFVFIQRTLNQFFGPSKLQLDTNDQTLKPQGGQNYLQFESEPSDGRGHLLVEALNTPRFSEAQNQYAFTLRKEFEGKLIQICKNLSTLKSIPGNQLEDGDDVD